MAKRRTGRVIKKVEPAVQSFTFLTPGVDSGQTGNFTIDLSQIACLANRRFYRQGLVWAVGSIKVISSTSSNIYVKKLPNTWVMSNAWEKGFRAWQKMNKDALEESPSVRPKFLDFKIFADDVHHSNGYGSNLLPLDASFNTYTPGEWQSSKIVIPQPGGATNSREIVAVGASYPGAGASGLDAVSLIEGYAASRGLPNIEDPNAPTDAADITGGTAQNWIAGIFDEGTEQDDRVIDDMITENNVAPYPFEGDKTGNTDTQYPNGANQAPGLQLHDFETVTSTTIGGKTMIKGGLFPCGLIRFDLENTSSSNNQSWAIVLDLVPGDHRGYLCSPMTEM